METAVWSFLAPSSVYWVTHMHLLLYAGAGISGHHLWKVPWFLLVHSLRSSLCPLFCTL
jgi:hypothetical protein